MCIVNIAELKEPAAVHKFTLSAVILAILTVGLAMALPAACQTKETVQHQADKAYTNGMKLLRAGRYQEALSEFKRAEQYAPQLPQGYAGEGIALALIGQPQEAIQVLRKALDLDPGYWVARRELGLVYWHLNQRDLAAQELRRTAEQIPTDTVVNSLLGEYEFANHHYSQAAALLAKASDRVAANPDLALMEVQALLEIGQTAPAGEKLASLTHRSGLSPQQTFQLAWLLGRAKHYKEAIDTFNSLPAEFPDTFERGYGLALAYYQDKQYLKCAETLSQLKTQGFERPELFSLLGVAEEDAGHTLEAYEAFRQGIYRFPEDDRNYLNAATLSVRHYNYDVAAEILSEGMKFAVNDYKLFLGRGVVYSMGRQLRKAESDYRRALDLAPQEGIVYEGLGICYLDQNEFDKAAETLREGIRRQPKDELLYYFLVDALMHAGITPNSPAYDQAVATVETCLSLNPNYAYAYYQRARLELLVNKTDSAIADLEHARSLEPDSQAILYQLAIAYRRGGRATEAAKLFAEITDAGKKQDAEWQHINLMNIIVRVSDDSR